MAAELEQIVVKRQGATVVPLAAVGTSLLISTTWVYTVKYSTDLATGLPWEIPEEAMGWSRRRLPYHQLPDATPELSPSPLLISCSQQSHVIQILHLHPKTVS
jgi:hypothetical protein